MSFDPEVPASLLEYKPAWTRLGEAHAHAGALIAALDDTGGLDITIESTGDVVGWLPFREVRFRYPRLQWSISADDPKNGGVGSTESFFEDRVDFATWQYAITKVMPTGVAGYDRWGAQGRNYLLLHEMAHTTVFGIRYQHDCFGAHRKQMPGQPYDSTSPHWRLNEKLANNIARAVATACGLEFLKLPNPGFFQSLLKSRTSTMRVGM